MAKASAASPRKRRGPAGTARSIAKAVKPPAPRTKRYAQGKVPKRRPSSCQHACNSEREAGVRQGAASCQRAIANIIQHYQCPITRELAIDPVVAEDGHIYERQALERWLQSKKKSPVTNKPMGIRLIPNVSARQTIEDLLDARAVDDDAAARFFFARAQMLATRSSNPGPDLEGARRDLERAVGLGGGDRGSTNFPIQFRVIDWMAQGVQICIDAAAMDEETKRWMIEVGNAMRFAISSALTERLTEWKALRVGTRVRVIGDTLELEQLCERPPPGAIEKVNWNPSMQSFAGQVCTIRSMGQPSHMNYILTRAGGSCYSFPYDAIILEH